MPRKKHHRRSIRLIVDGEMRLNDAGQMIGRWLHETENKFHDIQCRVSVVMPNHMHFIVVNVGADQCVCPGQSGAPVVSGVHVHRGEHAGRGEHVGSPLRRVVQWFKTMTTIPISVV